MSKSGTKRKASDEGNPLLNRLLNDPLDNFPELTDLIINNLTDNDLRRIDPKYRSKNKEKAPCQSYFQNKACEIATDAHFIKNSHGPDVDKVKEKKRFTDEYLRLVFERFNPENPTVDIGNSKFLMEGGIDTERFYFKQGIPGSTGIDATGPYINFYKPEDTLYFYLLANLYCHYDEYSQIDGYPEFLGKLLAFFDEVSMTGEYAIFPYLHKYLFNHCPGKAGVEVFSSTKSPEYYVLSNSSLKVAYFPSSPVKSPPQLQLPSPLKTPSPLKSPSPVKLPMCRYGPNCRDIHDPEHSKEYAHPQKVGKTPSCPYGESCYRRGKKYSPTGKSHSHAHGGNKNKHKTIRTKKHKSNKHKLNKHKSNKHKLNKRKTYKRKYI
jgi:hypothetical protein